MAISTAGTIQSCGSVLANNLASASVVPAQSQMGLSISTAGTVPNSKAALAQNLTASPYAQDQGNTALAISTADIASNSVLTLGGDVVPAYAQHQRESVNPVNVVSFKLQGAEFSYVSSGPSCTQNEDSVLRLFSKMVTWGIL